MFCLMPNVVFAQNLTVEGTVTDETGEPLIGVSVVVKGQGSGGVTDLNGHYRIASVAQGATLEFSYVGYLSQQRRVQGRVINVSLQPDTQTLEEVVVIAYGQQKKVTITGAVSALGGEELLKAPVASVANALQGKLPGMSVVQLSAAVGMTRGTLYKKLMAIVGKSPVEFIRIVRIKRGKNLLDQGRTNVSEVADKVGFSPKMFAHYFKEMYGESPSEYLKKQK